MTSAAEIAIATQVVCQFVMQSGDPRCAALRNLLLDPPPSDGADNKERFMAALEEARRAMTDAQPCGIESQKPE